MACEISRMKEKKEEKKEYKTNENFSTDVLLLCGGAGIAASCILPAYL